MTTTKTTMNAKQTAALIRGLLFQGLKDEALEAFFRYQEEGRTTHASRCRGGQLQRLGLALHGAEVVMWRRHDAFRGVPGHLA